MCNWNQKGCAFRRTVMRRAAVLLSFALAATACSPSPRDTTTSVAVSIVNPRGPMEVVLQIGDYHIGGNPDEFVSGPEGVVYGDGTVDAVLFDSVVDGVVKAHLATGHMSEDQIKQLLGAANKLPTTSAVGLEPADQPPLLLVSDTLRWEINDHAAEPFATYLASVRASVRDVAKQEWIPPRWIVRPFEGLHCSVVAQNQVLGLYNAPVYPHVLDRYPIGDC